MLTLGLIELLNSVYTEIPDDEKAKAEAEAAKEAEAARLAEAEASEAEAAEKARLDDEEMVPIADLRKFRAEAAENRKEAVALQAKLDAVTRAQEKATADAEIAKLEGIEAEQARTAQALKEVAEANATIATKDAKLKADAINTAVYRAANAAGFHDPADAAPLLDLSGIDVTDGEVDTEQITELVNTLAETSSYLLKDEESQEQNTGPSNPANPKGPKVKFTGKDEAERLKQQSGEARERGDMVAATKLYNRAWEMERGVKSGG